MKARKAGRIRSFSDRTIERQVHFVSNVLTTIPNSSANPSMTIELGLSRRALWLEVQDSRVLKLLATQLTLLDEARSSPSLLGLLSCRCGVARLTSI